MSSDTTAASDIGLDVDVDVEVVAVVVGTGADDDVDVEEEEEEDEAVVGATLSTSIFLFSSADPDTKTLDFESLLLSFVHSIRDCELRIYRSIKRGILECSLLEKEGRGER